MLQNKLAIALAFAGVGLFPGVASAGIGDRESYEQGKGDLNCDGRITRADVEALFAFVLGEEPRRCGSLDAMDVNDDGRIDIADAEALARRSEESRAAPPQVVEFTRGDVNGDGTVDIADFVALAEYLRGRFKLEEAVDAADVNGDRKVDIADLEALGRYLFGD